MAEIKATAAEIRKKADELRQLNTQFKQKVEALAGSEQNLTSMWEGPAKESFHRAFSNDRSQMDNFNATINQDAAALDTIAAEYDKRESMNVNIANQRNY